jgi:tRNA(fMet)-specific endonuclease VapC
MRSGKAASGLILMAGSRFLLDTNIVIALFAGDPAVTGRLAQIAEVFVPSVVVGELLYGARRSSRVADNTARVNELAAATTVLPCDLGTAILYGEIKDQLRLKGRPIPENDVWIAAVARQHSLSLASRDDHFRFVDGLAVEPWRAVP